MTNERATLIVERLSRGWQDRLRDYTIVIDGFPVASIRTGETKEVAVEPGHRRVWMEISWCRSRTLELDLDEGETVRLVCRGNVPPFLAILYGTILRDRYIHLQLDS